MTLVVLCIQLLLFANDVPWQVQSLCTLMTDPSYSLMLLARILGRMMSAPNHPGDLFIGYPANPISLIVSLTS